MPRPKRTRAVASRKAAEEPTAPQTPAQPAQSSGGPSSDIYDVSDREKEKIRRRKSAISMGAEQQADVILEPSLRQTRGTAMSRHDNPVPTSKTADVSSSDDVASPPEVGRRSETTARGARHTDVSGLDLDDSMFGDLEDSLIGAEESHNGTRSTDTSSFNVAAFRRRPRVSSIVGKDDAPIRPSSRGPNTPGISSTFSFGHFKRRAREPSILGSRMHRSRSRQPGASEDESGNEHDFTRLRDPTPGRARNSSAVPSRGVSRDPSPRRATRKRKSLEDQGGSRKRAAVDPGDDIHDSIEVDDVLHASIEVEDTDLPSTPVRASARAATPDPNDPDLAPPASIASSEDSSPVKANWETLTHRNYHARRTASRAHKMPQLDSDDSDISSPPSLTHSPNYSATPSKPAARGRTRKRETPPKVTTADLASLLPRRRHKQTIDVSSDVEDDTATFDDDDDELASHPRRPKRQTRLLVSVSNAAGSKGKQPAAKPGKGAKRTYGSHVSDKENDEGLEESIAVGGDEEDNEEEVLPDEETSQMMLARMGEELKNAAKKFKEVDRWELEFEEVTEPSSPQNAR